MSTDAQNVKVLVASHGIKMLHYEAGKRAILRLPSWERVIVKIDQGSLKVLGQGVRYRFWLPKIIFDVDVERVIARLHMPNDSVGSVLLMDACIKLIIMSQSLTEIMSRFGDFGNDFVGLLVDEMRRAPTMKA